MGYNLPALQRRLARLQLAGNAIAHRALWSEYKEEA